MNGEMAVTRYLARKFPKAGLYGNNILEATEVFDSFSAYHCCFTIFYLQFLKAGISVLQGYY